MSVLYINVSLGPLIFCVNIPPVKLLVISTTAYTPFNNLSLCVSPGVAIPVSKLGSPALVRAVKSK